MNRILNYPTVKWIKTVLVALVWVVSLFTLVTLSSQSNVAHAATYNITWEKLPFRAKYAFDTPNIYGNGKIMEHHEKGRSLFKLYVNGKLVFCIEPGVVLGTTGAYSERVYDGALQDKINQIIFHGYVNTGQTQKDYAMTLLAIQKTANPNFIGGPAYFDDFDQKYAELMRKVENHRTVASFNRETVNVKVGETLRLVDKNGTLSQSELRDNGNGTVAIEGNTLVITPTADSPSNYSVRMKKYPNVTADTEIPATLYYSSKYQNLVQYGDVDPALSRLNINVIKNGKVKIVKTDASSGKAIEGVEFTLYNATTNEAVKTVKTDNNGVAQVLDLDPAQSFYFKETRGKNGYMLNHKRYDVTVKAGETTTVNVSNEPVPTIHTKATAKSGGKESYAYETHQEIANMSNLVIGTTYNVLATQYSSTGEVLATQERSFVAKATSHTEVFEFSVPVKYVGDIVYGEDLFRDGEKVATHFDLKNKEQTVKVIEPKVETKATTLNGGKESYVFEKHYEVAKVSGLIVGFEYKLVATQYSSTGEVLATQERTFVAKEKEHEETFEFDVPVKYVGDIVYGEDLYRDGEKIAVHYDLSNKEQTIKVLEPKINTLAQIGGMKEQFVGEKKDLVDTLTYTDFKNGKVLVRTWVVKYGTDEVVGEVVEQVLELDGNGEVTVKLDKIDTSKLPAGKYTIMEQVFEVVEKDGKVEKGNKISEHVDPRDDNQSFTVKERPVFPLLPQTSTGSFVGVIGLGVVMVVGSVFVYRKRDNG